MALHVDSGFVRAQELRQFPRGSDGQRLSRALKGIARRFNAAELNSVQVAVNLGLYVATVSLQPRQVQEQISPDCPSDL